MRSIINDTRARIPFSVIGVLLLLGSSVTTMYITDLEAEQGEQDAVTLDMNEFETLVRYAEADLARCLNYAVSDAFDVIGQNPVVKYVNSPLVQETTPFAEDRGLTASDININYAKVLAKTDFNNKIKKNFQNDRCHDDSFSINAEIITSWEEINVSKVVTMNLPDRPFNHILDHFSTNVTYPTYGLFTTKVNLTVTDIQTGEVVFIKRSPIGTLVTNRFLLMEEMTREFDHRLDGSFGSLGVSLLGGSMTLSWLRGLAQYFLSKPANIISTDWLQIITNTGILFEEGFVFNSVDPVGMVYVGFETVKAVCKDLGKTGMFDTEEQFTNEFTNQTLNPTGTDLEQTYRNVHSNHSDEALPDELVFDATSDLSSLCEEEYQKMVTGQNDVIVDTIINAYSAALHTFAERTDPNYLRTWDQVIAGKDAEVSSSVQTEQGRHGDAFNAAKDEIDDWEGDWSVGNITLDDLDYDDPDLDMSSWILDEAMKNEDYVLDFDNSDPQCVIFDGEQWSILHHKNVNYSWTIETEWLVEVYNDTDSKILDILLEGDYNYNDEVIQEENVTVEFQSDSYGTVPSDPDHDNDPDIAFPFEAVDHDDYLGTDPNLGWIWDPERAILEQYKLDLPWVDEDVEGIQEDILNEKEGKIDESKKEYPEDENQRMHPLWLEEQVQQTLSSWATYIGENINATVSIGPDGGMIFGDEIEDEMLERLEENLSASVDIWKAEILETYTKEGSPYQGLFNSTAAKVLCFTVHGLIDNIYESLVGYKEDGTAGDDESAAENATNDAMKDQDVEIDDGGDNYGSMKRDTDNASDFSNALKSDPDMATFPLGFMMMLQNDGDTQTPGWKEPVKFAVKQEPAYFSAEKYGSFYSDEGSQDTEACTLKYRNFNIFSPGAGVTQLVEEGFDTLNEIVISGIDQAFDSIQDLADQQLKNQLETAMNNISEDLLSTLKGTLADGIEDEQGFGSPLGRYGVTLDYDEAVNNVLNQYSDDELDQFISDVNSTALTDEIINELHGQIEDEGLSESIENTIKEAVTNQVLSAVDTVVSTAIDTLQETLKDEFNILSTKLESQVLDTISAKIASIIPSGLPIIPFFTWFCTLNVWYIEIDGEIPRFTVIDTTDETKVDTLFGHTAQIYHRRKYKIQVDVNEDGNLVDIGDNQAVDFDCITAACVIVPSGGTGVGDRIGGWDEISEYP